MLMFLIGFYTAAALAMFLYVGFFCVLGGKSEDLWRPFVYAALWPLFLILMGMDKA